MIYEEILTPFVSEDIPGEENTETEPEKGEEEEEEETGEEEI